MNNRRDSYDDGLKELEQLNRYQDTFDVFINILIKRAPTVFILINMTLMIWMVQIIFSSKLDEIPQSIYFYAPFLAAKPIIDLKVVQNSNCPKEYEIVNLKPFPLIKAENITNHNLTHFDDGNTKFCMKKSEKIFNQTAECEQEEIKCSGLCVKNQSQCPITSIKKIHSAEKIPQKFIQFHETKDALWKYIYTKNYKESFITGIMVTFSEKCANDYPVYQKYQNFEEYWNQTQDCGEEGTVINDYYRPLDEMDAVKFLEENGIWFSGIEEALEGDTATLGYMKLVKFDNTTKCQEAQLKVRDLKDYLITPSLTESLLVVCFIFFTGCWAWLIGFYCFEGKRKEKNMIVILMATIELIVIVFTYTQNNQMFYTQSVVREISSCIKNDIEAAGHWNFGISSSSPFMSIMFCCTCFLLLQIIAQIIDRFMYEPYFDLRSSNQANMSEEQRSHGHYHYN